MKKLFVVVVILALVAIFGTSLLGDKETSSQKRVAVIRISGPLYSSSVEGFTGMVKGADEIMRQINLARADKTVAAVLLRIDSPGGSVTAAEEVAGELEKLKAEGKPVITSMGDMAASAGYWLASCTDYIYANPSTMTGSLGVYIAWTNVEELYKKIGLKNDLIKSGKYKDILSPDRPMTAEERQMLQKMVDEMYDSFVKQIASGRKLPENQVRSLADGRVYTGKQAKELGLVDALGNYYDALDYTAKTAGIEGKPQIVTYDSNLSWRTILKGEFKEAFSELFSFEKFDMPFSRGFN